MTLPKELQDMLDNLGKKDGSEDASAMVAAALMAATDDDKGNGQATKDVLQVLKHIMRDVSKASVIAKRGNVSGLKKLTAKEKDLVAIGWLCGCLHNEEAILNAFVGFQDSGALRAMAYAAEGEAPYKVIGDVREYVVIKYLDSDEIHEEMKKDSSVSHAVKSLNELTMRVMDAKKSGLRGLFGKAFSKSTDIKFDA